MKKLIVLIAIFMFSFSSTFSSTPASKDKNTLDSFKKSLININTLSELEKLSKKIEKLKSIVKKDSSLFYIFNEEYKLINKKILLLKTKVKSDKDSVKLENKTECQPGMTEITLSNEQTWSCINLGATEVRDGKSILSDCKGSKENCNLNIKWLGDYYQWGRNDDGFTKGNKNYEYDWQSQNNNAWGGSGTTDKAGTYKDQTIKNQKLMQGPCPNGRHIPTDYEFLLACSAISGKDCESLQETTVTIIQKTLKLPFTGYHDWSEGFFLQNSGGYYWSSTSYDSYSYNLFFYSNGFFHSSENYKAMGFNIRCLKN